MLKTHIENSHWKLAFKTDTENSYWKFTLKTHSKISYSHSPLPVSFRVLHRLRCSPTERGVEWNEKGAFGVKEPVHGIGNESLNRANSRPFRPRPHRRLYWCYVTRFYSETRRRTCSSINKVERQNGAGQPRLAGHAEPATPTELYSLRGPPLASESKRGATVLVRSMEMAYMRFTLPMRHHQRNPDRSISSPRRQRRVEKHAMFFCCFIFYSFFYFPPVLSTVFHTTTVWPRPILKVGYLLSAASEPTADITTFFIHSVSEFESSTTWTRTRSRNACSSTSSRTSARVS